MEERVLKDIGLCKNRILSALLNSPDFCELMLRTTDYTEEDIDNMLYTQVFPYLFVNDTQTEIMPYTCVEVDIPRVPTGTIKDMKIIIWCYAHKDCMKCKKDGYLGTRPDMLCDVIECILRDSYDYGIGKVELDSVDKIYPNKQYYGRQMIFNVPDFKFKKDDIKKKGAKK